MAFILALSGCQTLPGFGPTAMDIALQQENDTPSLERFVMVDMDRVSLDKINHFFPVSFPKELKSALGGTRAMTVGIGDALVVNIWEASADGLFSTTERKQVALQIVVDESGEIFIPYAGRIPAAGKNVETLRRAIEDKLKGKAVEPQVQVLISDNASNKVVVVGDVAKPGQYSLPVRGLRLMEAIAQSGGTREATYEPTFPKWPAA